MLTAFSVRLKHISHADFFYRPTSFVISGLRVGVATKFIFALCPEWLENYLPYNFF
jgi:hypothetical protein